MRIIQQVLFFFSAFQPEVENRMCILPNAAVLLNAIAEITSDHMVIYYPDGLHVRVNNC
jgi:hypothetical protein